MSTTAESATSAANSSDSPLTGVTLTDLYEADIRSSVQNKNKKLKQILTIGGAIAGALLLLSIITTVAIKAKSGPKFDAVPMERIMPEEIAFPGEDAQVVANWKSQLEQIHKFYAENKCLFQQESLFTLKSAIEYFSTIHRQNAEYVSNKPQKQPKQPEEAESKKKGKKKLKLGGKKKKDKAPAPPKELSSSFSIEEDMDAKPPQNRNFQDIYEKARYNESIKALVSALLLQTSALEKIDKGDKIDSEDSFKAFYSQWTQSNMISFAALETYYNFLKSEKDSCSKIQVWIENNKSVNKETNRFFIYPALIEKDAYNIDTMSQLFRARVDVIEEKIREKYAKYLSKIPSGELRPLDKVAFPPADAIAALKSNAASPDYSHPSVMKAILDLVLVQSKFSDEGKIKSKL